jgi:probable addiction module antidote protein
LTVAKAKQFDAAEYLDSPELIAAYLTEALETNDQTLILKAIGNAARSPGMTEVAEKAGVSRENLYCALRGDVEPEFGTIIKVLQALGISLVAQAQSTPRAA